MKTKAKQEIKALLHGAKHDIVQAVRIANGGHQPVGKDVAELMAAWGMIAKVVSQPRGAANQAYASGQFEMLASLTGEAA